MTKPVIMAPKAFMQLWVELKYQSENWSEKAAEDLWNAVEQKKKLLEKNPYLFAKANRRNIRRCNVTSYLAMYYQIRKDEVVVVKFYGTARDPRNLKF